MRGFSALSVGEPLPCVSGQSRDLKQAEAATLSDCEQVLAVSGKSQYLILGHKARWPGTLLTSPLPRLRMCTSSHPFATLDLAPLSVLHNLRSLHLRDVDIGANTCYSRLTQLEDLALLDCSEDELRQYAVSSAVNSLLEKGSLKQLQVATPDSAKHIKLPDQGQDNPLRSLLTSEHIQFSIRGGGHLVCQCGQELHVTSAN